MECFFYTKHAEAMAAVKELIVQFGDKITIKNERETPRSSSFVAVGEQQNLDSFAEKLRPKGWSISPDNEHYALLQNPPSLRLG